MSVATLLTEAASRFSPWKLSCRLCATVNVVLAGEQEIDSVQGSENDRTLLTAQDDSKQNGPWVMKRGEWERPVDYADASPNTLGVTLLVTEGASNKGQWRMTAPTTGDVTPGIVATTWTKIGSFAGAGDAVEFDALTPPTGTLTITGDLAVSGAVEAAGGLYGATDRADRFIVRVALGTGGALDFGGPAYVLSTAETAATLPATGIVDVGRRILVVREPGVGSLVVSAGAGDTVDDGASVTLNDATPWAWFIVTTGSTWRTIRGGGSGGGSVDFASVAAALAATPSDLPIDGLTLAGPDGGALTGGKLVAFSSLLAFDDHVRMVFSGDGTEACVLAIDAMATPVDGAQVAVFIPAGEAGSLIVADEFRNRDDDNLQAFDPDYDYWFLATYTQGRYVATGQVLATPDTTVPAITAAAIDSGAPDKLVLTMSEPAMLPALTGLSLTFNAGTPRTLSSIVSGNGTTTITLDLSGDVADGDDIDLVVASGRLLQDLDGNLVGTGTTAVTLSGFGGPAFAFGDELHLWTADVMTTSGGAVDSVDDQIGAADVVPGANRPTVTTIGTLAAPAWQFVADSHLAVDAADTLTSGYIACIVDLASLDGQFGLVSIGEFGAVTTIAAVLWKTPSNNIQGIVGDGDAGVSGAYTSAGVCDILLTWSATERSIYVNGTLLNTVVAPAAATNGGRWVLGDVPNKGGTFDAATVKMYEARVGPSHLSAGDASDYNAHRIATVGT